jgi:hypothetical protein
MSAGNQWNMANVELTMGIFSALGGAKEGRWFYASQQGKSA